MDPTLERKSLKNPSEQLGEVKVSQLTAQSLLIQFLYNLLETALFRAGLLDLHSLHTAQLSSS